MEFKFDSSRRKVLPLSIFTGTSQRTRISPAAASRSRVLIQYSPGERPASEARPSSSVANLPARNLSCAMSGATRCTRLRRSFCDAAHLRCGLTPSSSSSTPEMVSGRERMNFLRLTRYSCFCFSYFSGCSVLSASEYFGFGRPLVTPPLFVGSRFHKVERVMVLEPLAELRRDFQSINKLVAPRDGVFFFDILHDVRVTFGEDVKCELAHRLRTRSGRGDARDDFECAGIALGPSFAHEGKGAYCDAQDENGCFSHFKIVSEMQNQEAEVPCFASCSEKTDGSLLNAGLRLSTLGSVLEHLGELFNLFGLLDHADGEHLGGRGLLDFFVQLAGELVKALNSFAEFLLVLLQQCSSCGSRGLRV